MRARVGDVLRPSSGPSLVEQVSTVAEMTCLLGGCTCKAVDVSSRVDADGFRHVDVQHDDGCPMASGVGS